MIRWLLFSLLALVSCSETSPPAPVADELRIISLSPAMTRMLEDSGLGDHLVGRSAWCRLRTRASSTVPAVGDLHDRDWEMMVRLKPTHVLIQAASTATDERLESLSAREGWSLHAWPLRTMAEVRAMLAELPGAFADVDVAAGLAGRTGPLLRQIDDAMTPVTIAPVPRVLLISDGLPPLAWGAATYLGEILAAVGVTNVMGDSAWATISAEDVIRLDPEIILVVSAPGDTGSAAVEQLDATAVRAGRVHRIGIEDINLPGPHLAEVRDLMEAAVNSWAESDGSPGTR